MKNLNRRDFLKRSVMGLGAVTLGQMLAGCAPSATENAAGITDSPQPSPLPATLRPTTVPPTEPAQLASKPVSVADLAVARGGDDPEDLVRNAMAAIGGMERFVRKGASVVVKPNMCTPSPFTVGATTNPMVVAAVVKMCLEVGAKKVKVLDYPFGGPSDIVYKMCGVGPAVNEAGGEMETISEIKFVKTPIPQGKKLKEAHVYDEILKADVLINVPVAKNHGSAMYTLGLKNMMGTVLNRSAMHINLHHAIADLNTVVRPALTIIDCVRIMLSNGPTGGSENDIKKIDTVIASPDVVAADSYALSFFDAQPELIPYITYAVEFGGGAPGHQKFED